MLASMSQTNIICFAGNDSCAKVDRLEHLSGSGIYHDFHPIYR